MKGMIRNDEGAKQRRTHTMAGRASIAEYISAARAAAMIDRVGRWLPAALAAA